MSQKRPLPDIYKSKKRKLNDPVDADKNTVVDAKSGLAILKSAFPVENFQNRLPAIVMKHQIYSLVQNRTEVDRQLDDLNSKGLIRLFKLGDEEDDIAILYLQDYIKYVKNKSQNNSIVVNFLLEVVDSCPDLSYDKATLLSKFKIGEKEISELVQNGVLTVRDLGSWWLSIPGAGEFMKSFLKGRQNVLAMLRRAKYKEILYGELLTRKLSKQAKLGIQYYIHDIIGADLVTVFDTSSGKVVRLREGE